MARPGIPDQVLNWVDGREQASANGETFAKIDPATGETICQVARSRVGDIEAAVRAARRAYPGWRTLTPVARGDFIRSIASAMQERRDQFAEIVAGETGKSRKDARGEVGAAIEMGFFVAGEGRRSYGRTTTSAIPNKTAITVRQPLGVAGLIVAANTPVANIAWKVFPALVCGNAAVLKAAEDTPITAWVFAKLCAELGLPAGVLNVIQGFGEEAGAPLVASNDVDVISFTGSCEVGRRIGQVAGGRLAKVCLELGGKNPLIVCDDADVPRAVEAAVLSAFSNAGQRCASGSRLIVFDRVYEAFRSALLRRVERIKVGTSDDDDYGPVINGEQLSNMLEAIEQARTRGVTILTGGQRLTDHGKSRGFFLAPTVIEVQGQDDELSTTEFFGPITSLHRVREFDEAIRLANCSPYGLTAAVWTQNVHRAMEFLGRIESGVAVVNGATYGSEPHMPFGGLKQSGNGAREAGTEALDVYSDWKTVYINHDPSAV
jgi:aldehyde dehydrogenase (NAD+)